MAKLRGLIVDDSKFVQEALKAIFASDGDIEIAGVADDGLQAIEKVRHLKPDFVTMDLQMPVMNGLESMERILAEHPVPIFVISDNTDSEMAFLALSKGALEIIPKSEIRLKKAGELLARIKLLARKSPFRTPTRANACAATKPGKNPFLPAAGKHDFDRVVAIACSTGGPKALDVILSALPGDFPYPILIAQHIADGFVTGLVKWIDATSALRVKEGGWGEAIRPGSVYISPVDKHMTVTEKGTLTFVERLENDIYHPSCDKLLASAGQVYGKNTIGVILTGMGSDGVEGIKAIKQKGGVTLAQDEKSCAIFGMPKIAIEAGCIDKILPLEMIGAYLVQLAKSTV